TPFVRGPRTRHGGSRRTSDPRLSHRRRPPDRSWPGEDVSGQVGQAQLGLPHRGLLGLAPLFVQPHHPLGGFREAGLGRGQDLGLARKIGVSPIFFPRRKIGVRGRSVSVLFFSLGRKIGVSPIFFPRKKD